MATLPNVASLDTITAAWANSVIAEVNASNQRHADGPQGFLGVAMVTSTQSNISTEADITGLAVTISPPANRRLRIELKLGIYVQAASIVDLRLKAGVAQVQQWTSGLGVGFAVVTFMWYGYSIGGAVTYKITGAATVAPGINTTAGATTPAILLVEDIGKQ